MKIAIIGGGAAGMMAAATLAEATAEVAPKASARAEAKPEIFLIERNFALGTKVLLTGGGRCNLTTGLDDIKEIADRYPRGGKFLMHALYNFPPLLIRDFFESRGVPLKTENDQRVFPVSDRAEDIVAIFSKIFTEHKVNLLLNTQVISVKKTKSNFTLELATHAGGKQEITTLTVDKLILATGGEAYRATGSSGDGYAFAQSLGHHITALAPSLNSFTVKELWARSLPGVALQKAKFTIKTQNKPSKTYTSVGPALFTHHGITGPAIFAISSRIAFEDYSPTRPLTLFVDLIPDTPQPALEEALYMELNSNQQKFFRNSLSVFVPKSLAAEFCNLLQIPEDKKNVELPKKDYFKTIDLLKHLPLTIIGRAPQEEFVTAGGIDTAEVNPRTMESLICPGLYAVGELLNVDAVTGGFNLTAAWVTGRLAGESVLKSIY
ncbi:MAG: aminoacetone oxidase family FAD-binding enzyme [Candidatus Gracilibacteria bacterium]|jgi:hypothetical protein